MRELRRRREAGLAAAFMFSLMFSLWCDVQCASRSKISRRRTPRRRRAAPRGRPCGAASTTTPRPPPPRGGYAVRLDDKPVRTPARRVLAAPTLPLAQAIAAEWQAQRDLIDPAKMPLTRLANAIIDGVAERPLPVAAEIKKDRKIPCLRSPVLPCRQPAGTRCAPGPPLGPDPVLGGRSAFPRALSWQRASITSRSRMTR